MDKFVKMRREALEKDDSEAYGSAIMQCQEADQKLLSDILTEILSHVAVSHDVFS